MARALSLENKLASDKKPVKVGEDSTGLLLADNDVFVEKDPTDDYHVATKKYVDDNDFAGKIIGYTRLEGDLTSTSSFEIQNSLTVEDATHKVSFITPSTESVEIEATFLINANSTDTRIEVGLSDSSTYSAVASNLEYDGNGVFFTDDEVDDHLKTIKFVLGASQLASVGENNEFWIGFSTAGVTKTAYLTYGYRASHGIGEHPFIIKATILPSSIYDGQ
tara:strand:+ start:10073 stop:10735 length:663 start_codon:yes stop_codon:yes gene_type:complete